MSIETRDKMSEIQGSHDASQEESGTQKLDKDEGNLTSSQTLQNESSDEVVVSDIEYPGLLRLLAIFVALSCGVFEVGLVENIVATAAPTITDHFHSSDDLGWYGSA